MVTLHKRREKLYLTQAFKIIKKIDKVYPSELFSHLDRNGEPRTRLANDENNLRTAG